MARTHQSEVRQAYQLNCRELRAITRHKILGDRITQLKEACRQRAFWFGDNWSQPATPGAQAALRTLMLRYNCNDALASIASVRSGLPTESVPSFQRAKHALRHLWTARKV